MGSLPLTSGLEQSRLVVGKGPVLSTDTCWPLLALSLDVVDDENARIDTRCVVIFSRLKSALLRLFQLTPRHLGQLTRTLACGKCVNLI